MILLKFEPELKGDSIIDGHEGWINLNSFQFGLGRGISVAGAGIDRETSNPSFSEITLSKAMDVASVFLMMEAACGKSLTKATFHWIQTSGTDKKGQHYLEVILENPILSAYSISSGGDRPSETFSISYNAITVQYNQFEKGGTEKAGESKGWDVTKNIPKNKI
ncbi:MAG: type VI secretion system tube protein Hcp [Methylococcales bacterium]|nr:type VI secretion system tube protein Hcp [Methylococcales bacterium]